MGLQLPKRAAGTPRRALRRSLRTPGLVALLVLGVSVLAGCSEEQTGAINRLAMPEPASAQGTHILHLWQGAWIAALITGVIVWGLIFYAVIHYRRRSDDEVPIQTRYNLPLEIFYTIAPVIMVIVFFAHTVKVQNAVLDEVDNPDHTIEVVGQQWQWTFNYTNEDVIGDKVVYEAGTGSNIPTLWLPVDETAQFNLHSPDVIHDFGVPAFLMRMDVIPGRVNHYQIKPISTGDFRGKCYELCGVYHQRMIFDVKVVSKTDYEQHLRDLEAAGFVSDKPLLGGENADTQSGIEPSENDPEGEGK